MEEIPKPDPASPLQVGLTYNLKKSGENDSDAEFDSMDTVLAIRDALEGGGCGVTLLEADEKLPEKLQNGRVDIVFNIAEGIGGRGREAQVPAILSHFRIPFTGSDETTLCIALDKALCKRLLASYRIRTPAYRVVLKDQPDYGGVFRFPAIVKPNAEGSSKGISDIAVVEDRRAMQSLVSENIRRYGQDMLVEEYIEGREFTVGILGNGKDARAFKPMEITCLDRESRHRIYSYNVKQNCMELVRYECPAAIDGETEAEMMNTALKIYKILSCRDFARMDFLLSGDGKLYFIELNPLPGLAPGYSDYPMLAEFNGTDYVSLVRGILNCALARHGLHFHL